MANFFEHKDRRMIPNWRSFERSIKLGELNSLLIKSTIQTEEVSIDDYIFDWERYKTIAFAADLISAAVANNLTENSIVKEAAKYIVANKHQATESQVSLSKKVLNHQEEIDFSADFAHLTLNELHEHINSNVVRDRINRTKKLISFYPFNPIYHVELSRLYSIIGSEFKAVKAMKTALHLAPNNRFVLRSATRLFAHYQNDSNDYLNYIHTVLRNSPLTPLDPWLTSAEISIATVKNQTSKFIKKGVELINSKNIAPLNFTELASSVATVELLHGSLKKSKEFFNKALIHPNDNSLAQIEWASQKDVKLNINPSDFQVKLNFEALALDNFYNNQHVDALNNATRWFADMPFSKRPVVFGSTLASTILKDQPKAISFLEAGLLSHPHDPQLINNLAYSLSLDNKPDEALKQLEKIKPGLALENETEICLLATKGLALFRRGFVDSGRQLYLEAIEKTRGMKNPNLNWIAILNYAREEIRIKSEYVEQIMNFVNKIPSNSNDLEIKALHDDVIEMYKSYKETLKDG